MSNNNEMADWSKLCRGCMGKTPLVRIFDDNTSIRAKYHEMTTIMVTEGDGLPEYLCLDCLDTLNYAHQFKKKCLQVEAELKIRLSTFRAKKKKRSLDDDTNLKFKTKNKSASRSPPDVPYPLQAAIKLEDMSDEDDYYVVVIDEENDGSKTVKAIKMEDNLDSSETYNPLLIKTEEMKDDEEIYDSYDVDQPFSGTEAFLQTVEVTPTKDVMPKKIPSKLRAIEVTPEQVFVENGDNIVDENQLVDNSSPTADKMNFIQVLTDAEIVDGDIIEYEDENGTLISDPGITEELAVMEDGVAYTQEEVVVSNGDENLEQLNCDATEFVIDYEGDEEEAITVYQQEDGSFLCSCGNSYMDFTEYEKHRATHNSFTCFVCNKGFESKEILTGHTLLHENSDPQLACPFCNQIVRRNALTSHIKINHNQFRPTCEVCNKSFASENNLKRHMLIHAGVKHYECDICPKRFNQKIAMQNHRATHGDYSTLKCSDCLKEFDSEELLVSHKKDWCEGPIEKDDSENKRHICSTCGKEYVTSGSLRSHIDYIHNTQQTELLCSECGEVLPTRKAMYAHSYTHRQTKTKHLKRFSCNTCGKGCASHAMLLMHERVHTNERPYKCNNCSLAFKTKTHLTTHQLTHTQEKRFGCSVCMKFFALKGNLVVHLRTHTGERPYVCTICNQAFIDSKYLKKHKLRRHEIGNIPWNHYY